MKELEAYKNYLFTQDISQNTRSSYIRDILLYIKWYEESSREKIALAAFNDFEIMQYRAYLLNVAKYKASTINRKIIAIRNFCRWAVNEGLLEKNPTSNIKEIKDVKQRLAPEALSKQEVFKLRRIVHRYGNKRDIALIELMLNTGTRVSEVCKLKVEDIEISERKGILRVIGKGNKLREIPINSETRKYLRDYLEVKPNSAYLFVSQRGGKMDRSTVFRVIKKYSDLAGLKDFVHPHTFRHTFAQTLIDNGTDLFNVQYLLGHENITTTQRYHRPKLEVQEQAVENMYID
jgi:integrase/recombinase XerC